MIDTTKYSKQLSEHVETIFKKYKEHGLHVCDLATGGGKSHAIANLTCSYYPNHFERIVILCVQTKLVDGMVDEINRALAETINKRENLLSEDDILVVKKNAVIIQEALEGEDLLGELIDEMENKTNKLDKDSENNYKQRLNKIIEDIRQTARGLKAIIQVIKNDKTIAHIYEEEIEKQERNLRKQMRNFFRLYKKYDEKENGRNYTSETFLKEFKNLGKVYPHTAISKKRVLVMTIHKALLGIDPIIRDKMKLEDLVVSGKDKRTLFIFDESDQAAMDMRTAIIDNQMKGLGNDKYLKGYVGYLTYKKLVEDRDNVNNEEQTLMLRTSLDEADRRLRQNWQYQFKLDSGFNDILIGNNNELEKFKRAVFFAGPTVRLNIAPKGNKTETYICYKDGNKHFSLVHRNYKERQELEKKYDAVVPMDQFLTFNLRNINVIMAQLAKVARESLKKHIEEFVANLKKTSSNAADAEEYLSFPTNENEAYSLFARFGKDRDIQMLTAQLINYMTNRKNILVDKDKEIKVPDDSVYAQGIQLFEEEIDESDNQRHIRITCREIETTPEKILYNLAINDKVSVVLCSATANGQSVINNCDVQYLRGRLGSDMHFLSKEDKKRFDELVEHTYPNEHKVAVKRIATYKNTDKRPTGKKIPDNYKELFCEDAINDGSVDQWYNDLLSDNAQEYEINRWLQFSEVYSWFCKKPEVHSMLFFQNKTGMAKEDSKMFHRIARMIDGTYKDEQRDKNGNPIAKYIEITNKSEDLENDILPKLENDKDKKIMLVCAYGSFKAGVNMQYKVPVGADNCIKGENWEQDETKHKKDWDAIYLQAPSNYMSIDMSREKSYEESLYRIMLNLMMLKSRGCLSIDEIRTLLNNALSKQFLFSTDIFHGASIDKSAWALTIIEQAVGRLCRTRNKPNTTYIMYDEAIAPYFHGIDKEKSQTKEFRELVKQVKDDNRQIEEESDIDINEIIRYNKVKNAREYLEKTRRWALNYTVKPNNENLVLPPKDNIPFEVSSSQYVISNFKETILKHPAVDSIEELSDEDRKTLFIDECYGDWKADANGSYSYRVNTSGRSWEVAYDGKAMEVTTESVRLNVLMKNPTIRKHFEDNGYATDWKGGKLRLHPEILLYDYAGEIGEQAFLALLNKFVNLDGVTVGHLEGFDYELADFIIKDKEGNRRIAIDVKNMNPEALHYDRAGDLPSVEKVSKKEERLGCRLIIVNIVKINQPGLNEGVEILGLIDENGVPCLDKLDQLKFLIQGK